MSVNKIIVYLMVVFMALGAIDRIVGNRFGLGEKFEEGILAMAPWPCPWWASSAWPRCWPAC